MTDCDDPVCAIDSACSGSGNVETVIPTVMMMMGINSQTVRSRLCNRTDLRWFYLMVSIMTVMDWSIVMMMIAVHQMRLCK